MKLSDIFSVAEWTNRVLLVFVYHVCQSHTMIFTCAADDFQKSRKNAIFENCMRNLSFEKNEMFDVFFKMAKPVCSRLHFNLIKHFTQKTFIFKNDVFCILTKKKRRSTRKLFQNTTKLLSM